jgi:hypothetical protein
MRIPSIVITAAAILALQSFVAAASISSEYIQAEVARAARQYLGDYPPRVIDQTEYYIITTVERRADALFFGSEVALSLTVPYPAPSEMLISHPNYIEFFVNP